jgi:hypothetical protein
MPLSAPAARKRLHDRHVHCAGFLREDGLWDIEGHLVDTKSYAFSNVHRGTIEAGEPVHGMRLRLTVDDSLEIHAVEADTEHAPYRVCPEVTSNYQRLVGLRIGPGFRRAVAARLGGVEGCTHLSELLGPIATTAFQTMAGQRRRQQAASPDVPPRWLDTCHAHASTGEVVKELYPKHYRGE